MEKDLELSLRQNMPLEIIYVSNKNMYTKRRILVKGYDKQFIRAYCFTRKMYRSFKRERILSAQIIYTNRYTS